MSGQEENGGDSIVRPSDEGICNVSDADDEGEVDRGARKTKKMNDPQKPSKEEVEEHCKTHLPFRSWCRHCVRGRGKEMAHYRQEGESTMNEVHLDFFFMGLENEPGKTVPILAAKERRSKMVMASVVPKKTTGTFIAKRVLAFMKEVGVEYGDLVVKTDQEEALKTIVADVGRLRAAGGGGRYVVEHSPVGASQSNGIIERGIQSIEGQMRVILDAVEHRWNVKIPIDHPVICFIAEYAGFLLNRFEVSHDGKTSYERSKGKVAKTLGIEFGEAILWKRKPVGGALGKMSVMWEDGVYLGVKGTSGEVMVANEKGIWKTRSVQRKPLDERWDKKSIDMIKFVPWRVNEEDPKVDGELPAAIKLDEQEEKREMEKMESRVPRRACITREDVQKYGYSAKCPGCLAILRGTARQGHSEGCRRRLEEEMKEEAKVEEAKRKRTRYMKDAIEMEERNRKRKSESGSGASGSGQTEEDRRKAKREQEEHEQRENRKRKSEDQGDEESDRPEPRRETGEKRKREADDDQDEGRVGQVVRVYELEVNQEPDGETFDPDCFDDRTGEVLDPELVKAAEEEELRFMEQIGVGEECGEEECWEMTGKPPVTTKFVRVNKGSKEQPDVRARLCGRDFKVKGGRDDLFAAMPPLEAKKMLFRQAVRSKREWRDRRWQSWKLLLIDVKKAHLNGVVPEDVRAYVKLPNGKCWRLRRWLYGMRPAASAWEEDFTGRMKEAGYVAGKAAPTVFFNKATGGRCVVHGDDFTFLALEGEVKRMISLMSQWYDIKVRGVLGGQEGDTEEVTILNRRLSWRNGRIEYEADEKHVKTILEELGLEEGSNGLEVPVERRSSPEGDGEEEDEEMAPHEAKRFRALAARANYLGLDRYDIQYAAKEVSRDMARPRKSSWEKMKRLGRYLLQYPRLVWRFEQTEDTGPEYLDIFSDSDWAGDKVERKSTSGGVAMVAGGVVKTWSSTQATLALSVGEAEYYALIKAAAEGLGIQALAVDMGYEMKVRIWVDSTTAKAIVNRLGLGKVRHLEVKFLWAQQALKRKRFEINKVRGEDNVADIGTKPKSASDMMELLRGMGAELIRRNGAMRFWERCVKAKGTPWEEFDDGEDSCWDGIG